MPMTRYDDTQYLATNKGLVPDEGRRPAVHEFSPSFELHRRKS